MTSILDHQPPEIRSFPIKTEVKWALGIYIYGGCSKVLSFFSRPFAGPSRSFRKLSRVGFYHCRRKWFFVGARGFQGFMQLPWHVLCPLITDTLIAEEQEASQPSSFHVGVFLVGHNPP